MAIDVLFFDAVGTLFGLRHPPGHTYARFAQAAGIAVEPDAVARAFPGAWQGAGAPDYQNAHDEAAREAVDRRWWRGIVQESLTQAGATFSQEALTTCFDALFAHYGTVDPWMVYEETPDILAALQSEYRLAVLSNFDQRLVTVMRALGLANYFEAILYSSALGASKPARLAFEKALAHLGVPATRALHVGDDPHKDAHGASEVGLQSYLLDRPMKDLRGLPRFLTDHDRL